MLPAARPEAPHAAADTRPREQHTPATHAKLTGQLHQAHPSAAAPAGLTAHARARSASNASQKSIARAVHIPVPDGHEISGDLVVPAGAHGIVLFAHGSGSSRHSPRNRYVADVLNHAGLGTLLIDLLTPLEENDRANVFDIELLSERLEAASRWIQRQPDTAHLCIGYFGASTGGGAALWAASRLGHLIHAVVSRGGRPDLAGARLAGVRTPTLLIVGERDEDVITLNEKAMRLLPGEAKLEIIPGATHLFEEPGCLERVASHAAAWFRDHLCC